MKLQAVVQGKKGVVMVVVGGWSRGVFLLKDITKWVRISVVQIF